MIGRTTVDDGDVSSASVLVEWRCFLFLGDIDPAATLLS
jgi:hypothetical protein